MAYTTPSYLIVILFLGKYNMKPHSYKENIAISPTNIRLITIDTLKKTVFSHIE